MIGLRIEVDTHGPVFDHRIYSILDDARDEAEREVADFANEAVHIAFRQTFRNPTGYYESRVQVRKEASGYTVHDGGVVYGPWLEGVGERNKSTRFKGYWNFRRTAQLVERRAGDIAERIFRVRVGRY